MWYADNPRIKLNIALKLLGCPSSTRAKFVYGLLSFGDDFITLIRTDDIDI